jgi:alcohol dehydrogenase
MLNFIFDNKTRIVFGKDTEQQVAEEIKPFGSKKILLHYGGGSIKRTGLYDKLVQSLKSANLEFVELGGVKPNPRLSLVREGIKLCKEQGVDFILAVGGGSVIDSAKAIAFGSRTDREIWDYYQERLPINDAIPIGVVLTIPAAGSESSTGSVITNEDGWLKRSAGSLVMRPKFALMNPELTYTLPDYQTACGASDMLAHVFERYFTNTEEVDYTDHLCEATMKTIIKHGSILAKDGNNYDSRAQIMWAGTLAHNGLLGTGRSEDWASHNIEHELSALYDIAHGAGLSIIFPAWMKYVYKHDVNRFVQFAHRVFNIEVNFENLEETALQGIEALVNWYKELGLPTTFKDANLPTEDIEEMAKKATLKGPQGSFVKLNTEDIINIYKLAL